MPGRISNFVAPAMLASDFLNCQEIHANIPINCYQSIWKLLIYMIYIMNQELVLVSTPFICDNEMSQNNE